MFFKNVAHISSFAKECFIITWVLQKNIYNFVLQNPELPGCKTISVDFPPKPWYILYKDFVAKMKNLRLDNSIFLMFLASEEYRREHNLSTKAFLAMDKKYKILNYIAQCPDVFDSMTEKEMAKEIDYYVSANY